jgi:hypothetical protein
MLRRTLEGSRRLCPPVQQVIWAFRSVDVAFGKGENSEKMRYEDDIKHFTSIAIHSTA